MKQVKYTFNVPLKLKTKSQKQAEKMGIKLSDAIRFFLNDFSKGKYDLGFNIKDEYIHPDVIEEIKKSSASGLATDENGNVLEFKTPQEFVNHLEENYEKNNKGV